MNQYITKNKQPHNEDFILCGNCKALYKSELHELHGVVLTYYRYDACPNCGEIDNGPGNNKISRFTWEAIKRWRIFWHGWNVVKEKEGQDK